VKPVLFHSAAEAELFDAISFYESRRAGLGLSFQTEVQRVVDLIQQHPDRWVVYKNTSYRKCLLDGFPFSVFYLELEDLVWIGALARQKRKPGYWLHRQPP
jgi:toxin ParE1/3/4